MIDAVLAEAMVLASSWWPVALAAVSIALVELVWRWDDRRRAARGEPPC